ncbi:MAG TPA: hypothetical protein VIV54_22155, partial [Burkholderiales bacterium]
MKKIAIVLSLALLGGCALVQTETVAKRDLKNDQGHVIGYKEISRDPASGEELTKLTLFVPMLNKRGNVIGYEERGRGDTILRDVNGKRIGMRFVDLRSTGTNAGNKGVTIVIYPRRAD